MSKKTTPPTDPPEVLELFKAIDRLYPGGRGFDGVIVRSVSTEYANKNDFFSGVGAARTGGRWNPVGLEAIYASLDILTATEEAHQNFIHRGFPLSAMKPRVTAGASVNLKTVLDLSDAEILRSIGFTTKDLIKEDWRGLQNAGEESWTQAIGRGGWRAGFDGLIVPSGIRKTGKNIVIFPDCFNRSSTLSILGEDQLPS